MYNLYTDKQRTFNAKVKITGANTPNTKARLIIETNKMQLAFEGVIDKEEINVPISALNSYLSEGDIGRM